MRICDGLEINNSSNNNINISTIETAKQTPLTIHYKLNRKNCEHEYRAVKSFSKKMKKKTETKNLLDKCREQETDTHRELYIYFKKSKIKFQHFICHKKENKKFIKFIGECIRSAYQLSVNYFLSLSHRLSQIQYYLITQTYVYI